MTPSQQKAAQPGSMGGDGTISRPKHYPRRGAGARPNPEPWRPVRIGAIIEKLVANGFEVER